MVGYSDNHDIILTTGGVVVLYHTDDRESGVHLTIFFLRPASNI